MGDSKKGDPIFGARLKRAVEHSGQSRRAIALSLGITAQSAQRWYSLGYLSKDRIPAFCRACGVSIEWLLTGQGEIAAPNLLRDATHAEIIDVVKSELPRNQQSKLLTDLAHLISESR